MPLQWSQPFKLKGDTGEQGPRGLAVTRTDGAPTDVGQQGEIRIDFTNFKLYEYKGSYWTASDTFRGVIGMNGVSAFFAYGDGAPDATTYSGDNNGFYLRTDGQLFFYTKEKGWFDSGENYRGPKGDLGATGRRGSVQFVGNGPPPDDVSKLTVGDVVGALPGDTYDDQSGPNAPTRYYLS